MQLDKSGARFVDVSLQSVRSARCFCESNYLAYVSSYNYLRLVVTWHVRVKLNNNVVQFGASGLVVCKQRGAFAWTHRRKVDGIPGQYFMHNLRHINPFNDSIPRLNGYLLLCRCKRNSRSMTSLSTANKMSYI